MIFSDRVKLASDYGFWLEVESAKLPASQRIEDSALSVITFLDAKGMLRDENPDWQQNAMDAQGILCDAGDLLRECFHRLNEPPNQDIVEKVRAFCERVQASMMLTGIPWRRCRGVSWVCAECAKPFRLRWTDYGDYVNEKETPVTLMVNLCQSGGVYAVRVRCPHCRHEEDLP